MRLTVQAIQRMKRERQAIVMVTAYDLTAAQMAEGAGLSLLLVGDSLGMVVYGHDSTLQVTLDDMVRHTAAVVRGAPQALVVADLPFLSYASVPDAVASAGRLVRDAGAQAVKLEGGSATTIDAIRRLVELGIPVMGHLGYTPQSTLQIGLRVQGNDADAAARLMREAEALQLAGAFAVVLELVPDALARKVTEMLAIPVIGIGAGAGCDGQVQVWHDILGLYGDRPPRHSKRFAELREPVEAALKRYAAEVRDGSFPPAVERKSQK